MQTIALKQAQQLEPYLSPNAAEIPPQFKDPAGYWTGFAGRARVFIVNTEILEPHQYPGSLSDMLNGPVPTKEIGIALPLFGTTLTQAAALYTIWGAEKTDLFFKQIEESDIQILNGNSSVRDYVSQGKLSFGLTDTDDACSAIEKGKPVRMIIPDQDSLGTLVIPNTVALIKGGPNPELGKKFIDYLLHPTTLNDLIASGWCHVPLRKADESPSCMETDTILAFKVNLDSIYTNYVRHRKALKQQFLK
ncbi:MAG: extracellular solute-binding protein [Bacteroidetes bacterium]|nr:extracellular solute-binding protein [Bacteroidota bacterium]